MMRRLASTVRDVGWCGAAKRAAVTAYLQGVRPLLPTDGPVLYSGLPVALDRRWADRFVPPDWRPEGVLDNPDYEATLVAALRHGVAPGDRVVVVGGGLGVTAAVAALQAGPAGHVACFEAAAEAVETVRRTAGMNGVSERVTVIHAVVARAVSVYGSEPGHGSLVSPAEIPTCDVLELDCEGAEIEILRTMRIRPRTILVETHGIYDAPTQEVVAVLEGLGYKTEVLGLAEPRVAEFCEERDIRVVAATLRPEMRGRPA